MLSLVAIREHDLFCSTDCKPNIKPDYLIDLPRRGNVTEQRVHQTAPATAW